MQGNDKTYDVKITETAWNHMLEHARFLANVNVSAADKLVDEFVEKTETLTYMPERCPWLTHDMVPFQKYRKLLFGKHYMALYVIRSDVVFITAVVDCRQDYSWLL